jgi:hypothetical protein
VRLGQASHDQVLPVSEDGLQRVGIAAMAFTPVNHPFFKVHADRLSEQRHLAHALCACLSHFSIKTRNARLAFFGVGLGLADQIGMQACHLLRDQRLPGPAWMRCPATD